MSLRCLFGAHKPLLASIVRGPHGYAALCEACSLPLERGDELRWRTAEPLVSGKRMQHP